jgi:hypothetical protein
VADLAGALDDCRGFVAKPSPPMECAPEVKKLSQSHLTYGKTILLKREGALHQSARRGYNDEWLRVLPDSPCAVVKG